MKTFTKNKVTEGYKDHSIDGGSNPYAGSVIHRHFKVNLPCVSHGEGVYLFDTEGRKYIDASGGAAVSCLGHSDPEVIKTLVSQIESLCYAHTGFFTNHALEQLSEMLCDLAPDPLKYAYIVSSGSEAVESALKLARQYFVESGRPEKRKFIGRRQSYHGNTLGALGVGGNAWRKAQFEKILVPGTLIEPCYEYRLKLEGESLEDYGERAARQLEEAILQEGADSVAAFVAETVGGATSGGLTPVGSYFKRVREICDKYDVLMILDEVMCGSGRTGTFFAFEQEGVVPDIVTLAKALGGGYQPIAATIVSEKVVEPISTGTGFFQHGHTYLGHTAACACAVAVQTKIQRENLLDNVKEQGAYLKKLLKDAAIPGVGDVRGRGMFIGLEIVRNLETKTPYAPEQRINKIIKARAMERGLMCYPMGGTIDGRNGDHVLLAPPFICEPKHIEEIVDRLGDAITDATSSIS